MAAGYSFITSNPQISSYIMHYCQCIGIFSWWLVLLEDCMILCALLFHLIIKKRKKKKKFPKKSITSVLTVEIHVAWQFIIHFPTQIMLLHVQTHTSIHIIIIIIDFHMTDTIFLLLEAFYLIDAPHNELWIFHTVTDLNALLISTFNFPPDNNQCANAVASNRVNMV